MLGASTVINPIIKVLTTVAILAAVYIFFVKPTLDTTEDLANPALDAIEQAQEDLDNAFDDVPNSAGIQDQVDKAIASGNVNQSQTDKLLKCVQRANQDVNKIQACTDRFTP